MLPCFSRLSGRLPAAMAAMLVTLVATDGSAQAATQAYRTETPDQWFRDGAMAARDARGKSAGSARNIILFVGDGMSMTTIAAARILEGQRQGAHGEEHRLAFEEFPYTAFSRTYGVDAQTPESAGTMSAMMTGIKTRFGLLSVNQRARRGDCASGIGNESVTALELASAAGLGTGIVTTTSLTHATPAAGYAHSSERDWEFDSAMPAEAREAGCVDIARQFADYALGGGIDVAFGGGRRGFLPNTKADPEYPSSRGMRADGRDLIADWLQQPNTAFVWNAAQFDSIVPSPEARVLGLFEPNHLRYEHDRGNDASGEPGLADMTRTAIRLLQSRPKGYFLVVEGGRIDHAHHRGNAFRALSETIAFSDAVRAAVSLTDADDTLIIVTADHGHTLTMAGYPLRGNPILGKVRGHNDKGESATATSQDGAGRSYTTLNYANGPGHVAQSSDQASGLKQFPHEPARFESSVSQRPDLDEVDTSAADFLQEAGIPMANETHSGEDVAVYALGPGAEGVHGSIEQNVVFHLMVQASPAMRSLLCDINTCKMPGVPDQLPDLDELRDH
ncbi:alkaline phosphatase [Dokdonella sp.]|uniref:alkaline phosphatase n=1 Tax=Dokdonella sp. TaxID=2291710 RepID=UPI003C53856B